MAWVDNQSSLSHEDLYHSLHLLQVECNGSGSQMQMAEWEIFRNYTL